MATRALTPALFIDKYVGIDEDADDRAIIALESVGAPVRICVSLNTLLSIVEMGRRTAVKMLDESRHSADVIAFPAPRKRRA